MRFMRAEDGTAFNVDQIIAVGPANTIRRSKGFGSYLMVELSDGRTAVPLNDTGRVWPVDALDEFLKTVQDEDQRGPSMTEFMDKAGTAMMEGSLRGLDSRRGAPRDSRAAVEPKPDLPYPGAW